MAKPKAQTLQQKLGFFDDDLRKPKHDELMIWLDSNIENIVNDIFFKAYDPETEDVIKAETKKRIDKVLSIQNEVIKSNKKELESTEKSISAVDKDGFRKTIHECEKRIELIKQIDPNMDIPKRPKGTILEKNGKYQLQLVIQIINLLLGFLISKQHFKFQLFNY